MIAVILVTISVTLIAYIVLGMLEERMTARRRIAIVTGGRAQQAAASLDKSKIIAKLERDHKLKAGKRTNLAALLVKAGLAYSASRVRMASVALSAGITCVLFVVTGNLAAAGISGLFLALVMPRVVLGIIIARREAAFLEELPNALDMISRGLRAGMTLASCMKQISESTAEPLRSEFAYVVDLQKVGMPLGEAIRKMPERIDLLDLRFFTIVIEIQQKSGGNLAEILENISNVIRGRKEMRAKVKALVSEAKVSSIIIGALPVLFGAFSWYSDPETFSKFWTEPIGILLFALSGILYTVGTGIFIKLASPKL